MPRIVADIHSALEDLTRDLGLHDYDYDYGKNAKLKHRRGGGAAISAFRLGEPGTPYHVAANAAEEEQAVFKNEIGKGRLSDFFIGHRQSSTQARYGDSGSASDYLRQMNLALEHYELKYRIRGVIDPESLIAEAKKHYENTRSHAIEPLVEQARFTHVPTPDDLRALLAARYRGDLSEKNTTLRPEDEKLVGLLFLKYPYPDYVTNTAMDSDFPMMAGLARSVARRNRADFLDTLPDDQRKDRGAQIPSLWGLGVKFHNIKGYNAALGHESTNAVLDAVANTVLKAALRDAGIGERESCLAHYGGGAFLAAILPISRGEDGSFRIIGPEHFRNVEKEIQNRLMDLNKTPIKDFLALHDIPLPEGISERMTLGEIVNGDAKERGWKDGLTYTMTSVDLSEFEKSLRRDHNVGGAIAGMVQTSLNRSVSEKDARLHADYLRRSGASPTSPSPG